MIQKITSTKNILIKKLHSLQKTKNQHIGSDFLIEGRHIILEAMKFGALKALIVLENNWDKTDQSKFTDVDIYLINKQISKKLSETTTPSGWFGICEKPFFKIDFSNPVLILDNIQDPGNLGSLIRSASAFGFKTIINSPNSVSYYNSKVIRSTQGLFFNVNLITANLTDLVIQLKELDYCLLGTYLHNSNESQFIEKIKFNNSKKYALILGNESRGISDIFNSFISENVKVKMNPDVESLNVAIAGSIIMYFVYQNCFK